MRKLLLIAAMLLAGATASFAQLHVGAGYYGELMTSKWNEGNLKHKTSGDMHGFYAGASYNIAVSEIGIGLAPGAYFNFVGEIDKNIIEDIFTRRLSLELPVHVTYTHELGPGSIFAYAGPAFNVGLAFKSTGKIYDDIEEKWVKTTADLYKNYDGVKSEIHRFDCKLGLGVGYKWEHLAANFGWDFGLLNQVRGEYRDKNVKNATRIHSWHLGVAYVF